MVDERVFSARSWADSCWVGPGDGDEETEKDRATVCFYTHITNVP
jgi:hypothetical protein